MKGFEIALFPCHSLPRSKFSMMHTGMAPDRCRRPIPTQFLRRGFWIAQGAGSLPLPDENVRPKRSVNCGASRKALAASEGRPQQKSAVDDSTREIDYSHSHEVVTLQKVTAPGLQSVVLDQCISRRDLSKAKKTNLHEPTRSSLSNK
jgi:hypothetical protein